MELYSFFNSSSAYRVRIALALKALAPDHVPVNIRVGEQHAHDYVTTVNASASVPAIRDGELALGQSLAIIDWLDSQCSMPRLIPVEPALRARVVELSYLIACDIHPINNLRILKYLQQSLGLTAEQKDGWYHHWVAEGMRAVELLLQRAQAQYGGPWCFGAAPTLADCCLIPQLANARRFGCELSAYPLALAVEAHALMQPAFIQAAPQAQPDYVAA